MRINLITALCKNGGIGIHNRLPWHFKNELKYFSKLTIGSKYERNAVLMGHNTWKSLPIKPLHNRQNIVISKNLSYPFSFKNIEFALEYSKKQAFDNLWIIGGKTIYKEFIQENLVDNIYITLINKDYKCDVFTEPSIMRLCEYREKTDFFNNIQIDETVWTKNYHEYSYEIDLLSSKKSKKSGDTTKAKDNTNIERNNDVVYNLKCQDEDEDKDEDEDEDKDKDKDEDDNKILLEYMRFTKEY